MMVYYAAVIAVLGFGLLVNSYLLCVLLNRKTGFLEGVRLFSVASALNKLLLSGSGYAALSWKLKRDAVPLGRSLSAFAVFEFFSTAPWLLMGFYFGADAALKMPVIPAVIVIFLAVFLFARRKKISVFVRETRSYLNETKGRVFILPALAALNVCACVGYYFFLSRIFAMHLTLVEIARIFSVSFTVGYLSPVPSGLGIKESSLVLLLTRHGIPLRDSIFFSVTDRIVTTGFYLVLGFLFGAELIIGEMRRRARP